MRTWLILPIFLSALPSQAARVMPATLQGLVDDAAWVVLGEALTAEAYWQNGRILTKTTVRVDEEWLHEATPPALIDVVTLGGVVNGIGQQVAGEATVPSVGRVVLFLTPTPWGLRVVGLSQGVFYVDDAELSVQPLARRLAGLEWAGLAPPALPNELRELQRQIQELRRAP